MDLTSFLLCLMPVFALAGIFEGPPDVCPVRCGDLVKRLEERMAANANVLENGMEAEIKSLTEKNVKLEEKLAAMETSNSAMREDLKRRERDEARQDARINKLEEAAGTSTNTCHEYSGFEKGKMACSDANNGGSVCSFLCDAGYYLEGNDTTECVEIEAEEKVWSDDLPACVDMDECRDENPCHAKATCANTDGSYTCICTNGFYGDGFVCVEIICPILNGPKRGEVFCSDSNKYESVCVYVCGSGNALSGVRFTKCILSEQGDVGKWSHESATCKRITCPSPASISHGFMTCTRRSYIYGYRHGTRCTFQCSTGYNLKGNATLACGDKDGDGEGNWNGTEPTCQIDTSFFANCPSVVGPNHGNVNCTTANKLGSTCKFSCDVGYFLTGSLEMKCNSDEKGVPAWSDAPPTCEAITCSNITLIANGSVSCSNSNEYDSRCVFSCSTGYRVIGSYDATCVGSDEDGHGGWNVVVPTCTAIICPRPNIDNGKATCSSSNFYHSQCTFECGRGHYLSGTANLTCLHNTEDGSGEWTSAIPTCNAVLCPAHSSPMHGSVSCTNSNEYGSQCIFSCSSGYRVSATSILTCGNSDGDEHGDWGSTTPTCEAIICPSANIDNGKATCSSSNFYRSQCTFECNGGHYLSGTAGLTCLDNDGDGSGEWSSAFPTCKAILCTALSSPWHGSVSCTNSNKYGSQCKFSCSSGYRVSGTSILTCGNSDGDEQGDWSSTTPTCEGIYCSTLSSSFSGSVYCSNSNKYGSVCTFSCHSGYRLLGARILTCGDSNYDGTGDWNYAKPSCGDVNECHGGHNCHANANCENSVGSYSCSCRSGYAGNGYGSNGCEVCYYGDGASYRGYVSRTKGGRTCMSWSSQSPHEHTRTTGNYPLAGLESNYCRNPDGEPAPWCYTVDSGRRWNFCPVPRC